jgi:hypothetical protein
LALERHDSAAYSSFARQMEHRKLRHDARPGLAPYVWGVALLGGGREPAPFLSKMISLMAAGHVRPRQYFEAALEAAKIKPPY